MEQTNEEIRNKMLKEESVLNVLGAITVFTAISLVLASLVTLILLPTIYTIGSLTGATVLIAATFQLNRLKEIKWQIAMSKMTPPVIAYPKPESTIKHSKQRVINFKNTIITKYKRTKGSNTKTTTKAALERLKASLLKRKKEGQRLVLTPNPEKKQ